MSSSGDQPIAIDGETVVIIGAGPSGLALGIELGMRGIRCLVVERNDRVGYAPRAKTTNVRTRTHLRRWGIAARLAEVSPFGINYPSNVHFVTRLAGRSLAVIENASNCAPARNDDYPEHGQWVPQYKLEQVMREHIATLPSVTMRFSTEFVTAMQDIDSVTSLLRDRNSSQEIRVQSKYLVGADGAGSGIRNLIGAKMSGTYGVSRNHNIVFRAPGLSSAHGHGPGSMYWQVNPAAPSLIGPMDQDDIWFFMPTRLPEDFRITNDSAATLIRDATGIDLPYKILSNDEWVASSLIADRYRDNRIFLVGDACHLHPPFGGYGMNMGVADGVDLGWKLAAVCGEWGGPLLLDSYETERRAIHEAVITEAAANHAVLSNDLSADALEDESPLGDAARAAVGEAIRIKKTREFHTLGTVLGGCYGNSPVIEYGEEPLVSQVGETYLPNSQAGCLAPHIWRRDGRSIYDQFGDGFILICTPGASMRDVEEAVNEASWSEVPFTFLSLSGSEASGRYPELLTLVRPDQYVAWRGSRWQPGLLRKVSGWGGEDRSPEIGFACDATAHRSKGA